MGLGHFLSAAAYRTLAVSCLGYAMQILPLRSDWAAVQDPMLRRLVRGPGGWIPTAWLSRPISMTPLPSLMVDLELLHKATLMRTVLSVLPSAPAMADEIDELAADDSAPLYHPWQCWLLHGSPHALRDASRAGRQLKPQVPQRGSLQSKIYKLLLVQSSLVNDHRCWDRHLARWSRLSPRPPFPRHLRSRVTSISSRLKSLPVSSRWAVFRTWLNGWCTHRRFQEQGPCRFCGSEEDSIEHFTCCRLINAVGRTVAGFPDSSADRLGWLLLGDAHLTSDDLIRRTVFMHCLYRTHCSLRYSPLPPDRVPDRIHSELRTILLQHSSLQRYF